MPRSVLLFVTFVAVFATAACDIAGQMNLRERQVAIRSLASEFGENRNLQGSWIYKLLNQTSADTSNSPCGNATTSWIRALEAGDLWAWRMVDAAGKLPPSGLLIGNLFALGSYWECVNTSESANVHNYSYTPIRGQYCTATFSMINQTDIVSAMFKFKIGVCLPDVCNATALFNLLERYVQSAGTWPYVGHFMSNLAVTDTTCQLNDPPLTPLAISGICFVVVFALLLLVGTAYDTLFQLSGGHIGIAVKLFLKRFAVSPFSNAEQNAQAESDGEFLVTDTDSNNENGGAISLNWITEGNVAEMGIYGKCISAFSVRRNGAAIFSTKQSGEQLDCLHGMRFLSMVWIITGHTYSVASASAADALIAFEHYKQSWSFQVLWNAFFSVDTFFIISGVLTSYITLGYLARVQVRKFKWHLFYLHRYLRLTPVYAVLIFLYVSVLPFVSYGPQWTQQPDQACLDYWWTNILYINNFYNETAQCLGHTWYMPNDMQFHMISPLAIIPLCLAPIIGLNVIFLLVTISVISTAVIAAVNNFSANQLDALVAGQQTDSLGPVSELIDIYIKPYCRVGVYAMGILVGYILFRTKRKLHLNAWLVVFGWTVSTALAITVLWCLYGSFLGVTVLSTAQNVAYLSLSRIAWSISIGWVILACTTGYGGWVNSLLSWKAFAPLGRLTYCAYLVHPLIIPMVFDFIETAVDIREFSMYYYVSGNVVLAYAVALAFSLFFEAPFLALEKLLFGRD